MSKMRNRVNRMEEKVTSEEKNKENEQKEENVQEEKAQEKKETAEEKKPEEKKPSEPKKEKPSSEGIRVGRSHAIYVAVAVIFLVVGLAAGVNLNPTGQMVSTGPGDAEDSSQFLFINPTGCENCEELSAVAKEVAGDLGIPFLTAGFENEMEVPGYALIYEGNFITTAAFDSKDTLLQQICQLTGNEAICDEVPEQEPQDNQPPEVPKTDRPVANAFVMSYCPYGTQFMKAYVPVMELLGEKADVVLNFVHYLMHGEKEMTENNNLYCIQKEQGEKLTEYMRCFLEKEDSETCMSETGIDQEIHSECLQSLEDEFDVTNVFQNSEDRYPSYPVDAELAAQYGVGGSPSFFINGVTVGVNRSPEAIKDAICSAFNNPPEECETELSSEAAAPGFGPVGEGGGTDTTAGCG